MTADGRTAASPSPERAGSATRTLAGEARHFSTGILSTLAPSPS